MSAAPARSFTLLAAAIVVAAIVKSPQPCLSPSVTPATVTKTTTSTQVNTSTVVGNHNHNQRPHEFRWYHLHPATDEPALHNPEQYLELHGFHQHQHGFSERLSFRYSEPHQYLPCEPDNQPARPADNLSLAYMRPTARQYGLGNPRSRLGLITQS